MIHRFTEVVGTFLLVLFGVVTPTVEAAAFVCRCAYAFPSDGSVPYQTISCDGPGYDCVCPDITNPVLSVAAETCPGQTVVRGVTGFPYDVRTLCTRLTPLQPTTIPLHLLPCKGAECGGLTSGTRSWIREVTRTVNVSSPECSFATQTEECVDTSSCVREECVVSEWSPWTGCSRTCRDSFSSMAAVRTRTRRVVRLPHNGVTGATVETACPPLRETMPCNASLPLCVVEEAWSTNHTKRNCSTAERLLLGIPSPSAPCEIACGNPQWTGCTNDTAVIRRCGVHAAAYVNDTCVCASAMHVAPFSGLPCNGIRTLCDEADLMASQNAVLRTWGSSCTARETMSSLLTADVYARRREVDALCRFNQTCPAILPLAGLRPCANASETLAVCGSANATQCQISCWTPSDCRGVASDCRCASTGEVYDALRSPPCSNASYVRNCTDQESTACDGCVAFDAPGVCRVGRQCQVNCSTATGQCLVIPSTCGNATIDRVECQDDDRVRYCGASAIACTIEAEYDVYTGIGRRFPSTVQCSCGNNQVAIPSVSRDPRQQWEYGVPCASTMTLDLPCSRTQLEQFCGIALGADLDRIQWDPRTCLQRDNRLINGTCPDTYTLRNCTANEFYRYCPLDNVAVSTTAGRHTGCQMACTAGPEGVCRRFGRCTELRYCSREDALLYCGRFATGCVLELYDAPLVGRRVQVNRSSCTFACEDPWYGPECQYNYNDGPCDVERFVYFCGMPWQATRCTSLNVHTAACVCRPGFGNPIGIQQNVSHASLQLLPFCSGRERPCNVSAGEVAYYTGAFGSSCTVYCHEVLSQDCGLASYTCMPNGFPQIMDGILQVSSNTRGPMWFPCGTNRRYIRAYDEPTFVQSICGRGGWTVDVMAVYGSNGVVTEHEALNGTCLCLDGYFAHGEWACQTLYYTRDCTETEHSQVPLALVQGCPTYTCRRLCYPARGNARELCFAHQGHPCLDGYADAYWTVLPQSMAVERCGSAVDNAFASCSFASDLAFTPRCTGAAQCHCRMDLPYQLGYQGTDRTLKPCEELYRVENCTDQWEAIGLCRSVFTVGCTRRVYSTSGRLPEAHVCNCTKGFADLSTVRMCATNVSGEVCSTPSPVVPPASCGALSFGVDYTCENRVNPVCYPTCKCLLGAIEFYPGVPCSGYRRNCSAVEQQNLCTQTTLAGCEMECAAQHLTTGDTALPCRFVENSCGFRRPDGSLEPEQLVRDCGPAAIDCVYVPSDRRCWPWSCRCAKGAFRDGSGRCLTGTPVYVPCGSRDTRRYCGGNTRSCRLRRYLLPLSMVALARMAYAVHTPNTGAIANIDFSWLILYLNMTVWGPLPTTAAAAVEPPATATRVFVHPQFQCQMERVVNASSTMVIGKQLWCFRTLPETGRLPLYTIRNRPGSGPPEAYQDRFALWPKTLSPFSFTPYPGQSYDDQVWDELYLPECQCDGNPFSWLERYGTWSPWYQAANLKPMQATFGRGRMFIAPFEQQFLSRLTCPDRYMAYERAQGTCQREPRSQLTCNGMGSCNSWRLAMKPLCDEYQRVFAFCLKERLTRSTYTPLEYASLVHTSDQIFALGSQWKGKALWDIIQARGGIDVGRMLQNTSWLIADDMYSPTSIAQWKLAVMPLLVVGVVGLQMAGCAMYTNKWALGTTLVGSGMYFEDGEMRFSSIRYGPPTESTPVDILKICYNFFENIVQLSEALGRVFAVFFECVVGKFFSEAFGGGDPCAPPLPPLTVTAIFNRTSDVSQTACGPFLVDMVADRLPDNASIPEKCMDMLMTIQGLPWLDGSATYQQIANAFVARLDEIDDPNICDMVISDLRDAGQLRGPVNKTVFCDNFWREGISPELTTAKLRQLFARDFRDWADRNGVFDLDPSDPRYLMWGKGAAAGGDLRDTGSAFGSRKLEGLPFCDPTDTFIHRDDGAYFDGRQCTTQRWRDGVALPDAMNLGAMTSVAKLLTRYGYCTRDDIKNKNVVRFNCSGYKVANRDGIFQFQSPSFFEIMAYNVLKPRTTPTKSLQCGRNFMHVVNCKVFGNYTGSCDVAFDQTAMFYRTIGEVAWDLNERANVLGLMFFPVAHAQRLDEIRRTTADFLAGAGASFCAAVPCTCRVLGWDGTDCSIRSCESFGEDAWPQCRNGFLGLCRTDVDPDTGQSVAVNASDLQALSWDGRHDRDSCCEGQSCVLPWGWDGRIGCVNGYYDWVRAMCICDGGWTTDPRGRCVISQCTKTRTGCFNGGVCHPNTFKCICPPGGRFEGDHGFYGEYCEKNITRACLTISLTGCVNGRCVIGPRNEPRCRCASSQVSPYDGRLLANNCPMPPEPVTGYWELDPDPPPGVCRYVNRQVFRYKVPPHTRLDDAFPCIYIQCEEAGNCFCKEEFPSSDFLPQASSIRTEPEDPRVARDKLCPRSEFPYPFERDEELFDAPVPVCAAITPMLNYTSGTSFYEWTGTTCTIPSAPCLNGGVPTHEPTFFDPYRVVCKCPGGFAGQICERSLCPRSRTNVTCAGYDVHGCAVNGGDCRVFDEATNGLRCTRNGAVDFSRQGCGCTHELRTWCQQPGTDSICTGAVRYGPEGQRLDVCVPYVNASAGAIQYRCECPEGRAGLYCERTACPIPSYLSGVLSEPCNGRICGSISGRCDCDNANRALPFDRLLTGEHCEYDVTLACGHNPPGTVALVLCAEHGTCVLNQTTSTFGCRCDQGYSGEFCQRSPCAASDCGFGDCVPSLNSVDSTCRCWNPLVYRKATVDGPCLQSACGNALPDASGRRCVCNNTLLAPPDCTVNYCHRHASGGLCGELAAGDEYDLNSRVFRDGARETIGKQCIEGECVCDWRYHTVALPGSSTGAKHCVPRCNTTHTLTTVLELDATGRLPRVNGFPVMRFGGCVCHTGYTAESNCTQLKCVHGTTLRPDGSCECPPAYMGDTCAVSRCAGRGTVLSSGLGCTCDYPFLGTFCQDTDPAALVCLRNGTLLNATTCACPPPYSGRSCGEHLCANGGTPTNNGTCECPVDRWSGPYCADRVCLNGGTRDPVTNLCSCRTQYSGDFCELRVCGVGGNRVVIGTNFSQCFCSGLWTADPATGNCSRSSCVNGEPSSAVGTSCACRPPYVDRGASFPLHRCRLDCSEFGVYEESSSSCRCNDTHFGLMCERSIVLAIQYNASQGQSHDVPLLQPNETVLVRNPTDALSPSPSSLSLLLNWNESDTTTGSNRPVPVPVTTAPRPSAASTGTPSSPDAPPEGDLAPIGEPVPIGATTVGVVSAVGGSLFIGLVASVAVLAL